jgi:ADP-ribose pyrophosphatase YjhB (NUDIX family)
VHYIKKKILDSLRVSKKELRYTDLMLDGEDPRIFRYHLNDLVKKGYIRKDPEGYILSATGESLSDRLSSNTVNAVKQPKPITYTYVECQDRVLVWLKPRKPNIDKYNLISGKVHFGESIINSSIREVFEKAGIKITRPELAGWIEFISRGDARNAKISVIGPVFYAKLNCSLEEARLEDSRDCRWLKLSDITENSKSPEMNAVIEVVDQYERSGYLSFSSFLK